MGGGLDGLMALLAFGGWLVGDPTGAYAGQSRPGPAVQPSLS